MSIGSEWAPVDVGEETEDILRAELINKTKAKPEADNDGSTASSQRLSSNLTFFGERQCSELDNFENFIEFSQNIPFSSICPYQLIPLTYMLFCNSTDLTTFCQQQLSKLTTFDH